MKIVVVGAPGTIGKHIVQSFAGSGHELVRVGRSSGDFKVDIENVESVERLFRAIGPFDALVSAAGEVKFRPLAELSESDWTVSVASKLLGQIRLVQQAVPYIREGGSFTLISGVLSEEPIRGGVIASTLDRAIEGFAMAAAAELPKRLRINVVNPSLLRDSVVKYGPAFSGFIPVEGERVAAAYQKSVLGVQTGQVFKVF